MRYLSVVAALARCIAHNQTSYTEWQVLAYIIVVRAGNFDVSIAMWPKNAPVTAMFHRRTERLTKNSNFLKCNVLSKWSKSTRPTVATVIILLVIITLRNVLGNM